jgi:hypothetical protein
MKNNKIIVQSAGLVLLSVAGRYAQRGKIILFTLILTFVSCGLNTHKYSKTIKKHELYFVVHLNEVKGDTINFNTIEIYSSNRIFDVTLTDSLGEELAISHNYKKLLKREYNKGVCSGVKKGLKGDIIILSTKSSDIDSLGVVTFSNIIKSKRIDFSELYRFPR